MPRKNHRTNDHRSGGRGSGQHRAAPRGPSPAAGAARPDLPLTDLQPDDSVFESAKPFNVILTAHASRQMEDLGAPALRALRYLQEAAREELEWSAQPMPSQHGRDVWLLGAGTVRVLFDVEDDDLTVQGFGLQPHRNRFGW